MSIVEHYYDGGLTPAHAASSAAPAQNLPDFINLAKKVGPSVVNVSTSRIRGAAQEAPSPFGDNDPGKSSGSDFLAGAYPVDRSAKAASVRASSSTATARF